MYGWKEEKNLWKPFSECRLFHIIGETLFITSSPHLGTFYHSDKNILFILANHKLTSKLNRLYNAEKIVIVDKHIRNGEYRIESLSEYTVVSGSANL